MINSILLALVCLCGSPETTPEYQQLVTEQNAKAFEAAAERAIPSQGTYRTVESAGVFGRSAGRFGGPVNLNTSRQSTTTFVPGSAGYGGGPVRIINPFVQP